MALEALTRDRTEVCWGPQGAGSRRSTLMRQSLLPPPNAAQASLPSVGPGCQAAHGRSLRECFSGTLGEAVRGLCKGPPPPHPPAHARSVLRQPGAGSRHTSRVQVALLSCGHQQCDEQPPCPSSSSAQKQGALPMPSLSALLWEGQRRSNLDSPRLYPEAPLLICHW